MLVERSEITVKPGSAQAFLEVLRNDVGPLLERTPGVRKVEFGRGVENSDKFMLLVEWETMDAHTAFTQAPSFGELRKLIFPHSTGGAMEHFEMG